MKGGFLHNEVLLKPFADHFTALGAEVLAEHPVEPGRSPRSVDLFVVHGSDRIVVEAELTPRRVVLDIEKARVLGATLLLVVMPTAGIARAAERLLAGRSRAGMSFARLPLWIEPLGPAKRRVRDRFPLPFNPIHTQTTNQKHPSRGTGRAAP
jgi:hypothetical protein